MAPADPLFGDTIAAIATPPGRGAIALVRVSGGDAALLLRTLCPDLKSLPPPRLQQLLTVRHPQSAQALDQALVGYFPAPRSYTGEDMVEFSTHGGLLTPQLILGAALAAGARRAEPGEFTRRAVLNGKLDLTQAEAVADLIDASSPALHRSAVHQLERGLTRRIQELRTAIIHSEALVAYGIDFPDEDEPPVPPAQVKKSVAEVIARIQHMLSTAPEGALLREGALVVLAGAPNEGKSSLFNVLVGLERSIVTELPGTTRDAVEASAILDGYPFRLVDTAGLRETEDRVEELGVEVARRYLAAADVLLYCLSAERGLTATDRQFLDGVAAERVVLVRTKIDLVGADGPARELSTGFPSVAVSATTGIGISQLRSVLSEKAFGLIRREEGEEPIVTRERHAAALREASGELMQFQEAVEQRVPTELAATHLAAAAESLQQIIGAVTPDEILGAVFSQFCVGK